MARINIVVPRFEPLTFTGGMWCIMEYGWGLMQRGHEVKIIPVVASPRPRWFDKPGLEVVTGAQGRRLSSALRKTLRFVYEGVQRVLLHKRGTADSGREMVAACLLATNPALYPIEVDMAARLMHLRRVIPPADITLATSYVTALPVRLFGQGRLFYFAQHYEILFKDESGDPCLAGAEAEATYNVGLNMIANSSWLRQKLQARVPASEVHLCPNAINHDTFSGTPKRREAAHEVRVISYGGRGARWKGFEEMAEAVKIARNLLPGTNVRWLVYGKASFPPRNPVADYEPLGFLNPPLLAKAYTTSDILLSASWYESFPLFPIEAMACGLPVVTTQPGTEEYAIPGETAEVVEPRDPQGIAKGLIHLIQDRDYAAKIAAAGWEISKEFTWERSVGRMESILLGKGTPQPAAVQIKDSPATREPSRGRA